MFDLPSVAVDIQDLFTRDAHYEIDFNEVKGQEHVKRALEIAAAGGHNVITVYLFFGLLPHREFPYAF